MNNRNMLWNPYYSPYSPQQGSRLNPQAFFGSLLGGVIGKPLGGLIGGLFGGEGGSIGETIGGLAGSVGGTFLPFSAGPQFSIAGAEPQQASGSGGSKAILLPQSAVSPEVKTALSFQTSLVKGGVQGVVGDLTKAVAETTNISPDAKSELEALNSRALDFLEAGDYQKALVQAYIGNFALQAARTMSAQNQEVGGSQPVPTT
jgi:hypothetical protein